METIRIVVFIAIMFPLAGKRKYKFGGNIYVGRYIDKTKHNNA